SLKITFFIKKYIISIHVLPVSNYIYLFLYFSLSISFFYISLYRFLFLFKNIFRPIIYPKKNFLLIFRNSRKRVITRLVILALILTYFFFIKYKNLDFK